MLRLYTVFHLNLAYSSIEEEQRHEVIRRCYWPLLHLVRNKKLPFGIEASGHTLEIIKTIDSGWVDELQRLTAAGICEFVGSGFSQIIGPLVPADVNLANLRLGNQVYERLLGFTPKIALVNEQAYSAGLVPIYLESGYQAIVMEWNNPARCHPEWNQEWRFLPQLACGPEGATIPVIWGDAIAFQKFQRYVHGETALPEYVDYLQSHRGEGARAFPLYCNDIEIFDFRPGRYHTETALQAEEEWKRIDHLFEALVSDYSFPIIPPSKVLDLLEMPEAGNRLHLESPEQAIPVKKQGKYNVTRWAVTGRDDLGINTACWRIYQALKSRSPADNSDWRELCLLWGSDFRTHITEKRWRAYRDKLAAFEKRINTVPCPAIPDTPACCPSGSGGSPDPYPTVPVTSSCRPSGSGGSPDPYPTVPVTSSCCPSGSGGKPDMWPPDVSIEHNRDYLTISTKGLGIRLNCRRGLALDRLWTRDAPDQWLCGTLGHGYYDDINWGADYYTGHLVFEAPGQPKVTDLSAVDPEIMIDESSGRVLINATVPTPLGPIRKQVGIYRAQPRVDLRYQMDWPRVPAGSLRLGHITMNPQAFQEDTLFFRTHNGGKEAETSRLDRRTVAHGESVSYLVSAQGGLGLTEGMIELGDASHMMRVLIANHRAALIGMVTYQQIGSSYFFRLAFSGREMDETGGVADREETAADPPLVHEVSLRCTSP